MSLEPMQDAIGAILQRLGVTEPKNINRLLDDWAEVAGPPWDRKAVPVGLRHRELVVEVADGATATILRYQVGDLLKRLDGELGEGVVDTVRIRVGR
jgi:hypothetical protein